MCFTISVVGVGLHKFRRQFAFRICAAIVLNGQRKKTPKGAWLRFPVDFRFCVCVVSCGCEYVEFEKVHQRGTRIGTRIAVTVVTSDVTGCPDPPIAGLIDIVTYERISVCVCVYREGYLVQPGFTQSKVYEVTPLLANNKDKWGLALDGQLKHEDTNLASSTL